MSKIICDSVCHYLTHAFTLLQGRHLVIMSNSVASYDQLVRQVEDLRKENSHLRRELEDNSHHLSKLENETSDMKVSIKFNGILSSNIYHTSQKFGHIL